MHPWTGFQLFARNGHFAWKYSMKRKGKRRPRCHRCSCDEQEKKKRFWTTKTPLTKILFSCDLFYELFAGSDICSEFFQRASADETKLDWSDLVHAWRRTLRNELKTGKTHDTFLLPSIASTVHTYSRNKTHHQHRRKKWRGGVKGVTTFFCRCFAWCIRTIVKVDGWVRWPNVLYLVYRISMVYMWA